MPKILDEWLGYCHRTEIVPQTGRSKNHNKWWAACLLQEDDGSGRIHTLYAGLGKKSSERIERFNEKGKLLTVPEARHLFNALIQEKQSPRKGYGVQQFGIPFGSPTPTSVPSFSQRFSSPTAPTQPVGQIVSPIAPIPAALPTGSRLIPCPTCGTVTPLLEEFCSNCGMELVTLPWQNAMIPPTTRLANTLRIGPLSAGFQLKQGRYTVVEKIGSGGMGAVYKVLDQDFACRIVALKELIPDSRLNTQQVNDAVDAFKQEAMLLAPLSHLSLPRIYDHFLEAGRSYLVMDFIEGWTLEDLLEKAPDHRLPLDQVLRIGIDLCDVLNYLHTLTPSIIFRDLKPANVMVNKSGHLFLIDFGIARLFKLGQQKDTVRLGSPGYAAPEQYGKSQSTPKTDLYALGATLYHALTGRDPSDHPFRFPPFPREIEHSVGLEPLILGLVTFDVPLRTPATAVEVKKELEGIFSLHLRQKGQASR